MEENDLIRKLSQFQSLLTRDPCIRTLAPEPLGHYEQGFNKPHIKSHSMWLYRSKIPKLLVVVPARNKLSTELSSVIYINPENKAISVRNDNTGLMICDMLKC